MNTGTKKAVALALTTAKEENETLNRTYLKATLLSRKKEQIGQLLFYLQTSTETGKQDYWQRFETSLREYIDLKLNGLRNG